MSVMREFQSKPPVGLSVESLDEASFLSAIGRKLPTIDGAGPRVRFIFDDASPVDLEAFRSGAPVPAITFATTRRRLFALLKLLRVDSAGQAVGGGR